MSKSDRSLYADWKDIANSYYDKSLSLAILFILFSFLVSPKIEVKPYVAEIKLTEAIEIPPEIREPIKPPPQPIRQTIEISVTGDEPDNSDKVRIIDTIDPTTLDPREDNRPPDSIFGKTPEFVPYDEPPVPIRTINPEYPSFAKQQNIQGTVLLRVEVFKDGSVGEVRVHKSLMSGPRGLDQTAIDAVKQWQFRPAQMNGNPVAVWAIIPIEFILN